MKELPIDKLDLDPSIGPARRPRQPGPKIPAHKQALQNLIPVLSTSRNPSAL